MKAFDYILFALIFCFGLFALSIGILGFFDDTPFVDAFGSFFFGVLFMAGAFGYKVWISNKIRQDEIEHEKR